jgi:hypothetical protein
MAPLVDRNSCQSVSRTAYIVKKIVILRATNLLDIVTLTKSNQTKNTRVLFGSVFPKAYRTLLKAALAEILKYSARSKEFNAWHAVDGRPMQTFYQKPG